MHIVNSMPSLLGILIVVLGACSLLVPGAAQQATEQPGAQVTVDFAQDQGPVTHRASGILHSISATEPADDTVLPLKLRAFRGRANEGYLFAPGFYERLQRLGVQHVQVVVSDSWGYAADRPWPGDDDNWTPWEQFLQHLFAQVHDRKLSVEWDIWNEPNIEQFWRRDRARFFETWRRGVAKLRALDNNAVIVGPSITHYDLQYLQEFLRFEKQHDALPDILCWHELSSADGFSIAPHAQQIRDWMMQQGERVNRISINEIIPDSRKFSPGVTASYLAGIERAGAESACHACWGDGTADKPVTNCENTSLDGLLTADTKRPRSNWWAYQAYGAMTGRFVAFVRDEKVKVDGVAGYDAASATALVLLGSCEPQSAPALQLKLLHLDRTARLLRNGKLHVLAERIPDTEKAALVRPEPILDQDVQVENNQVTISIPSVPPQSALTLRLQRPGN